MIEVGEIELAVDELRWLLEDCRDFIQAHRLLGELALESGDITLARAHFGFGYDIGQAALPPIIPDGGLPYHREANQPYFESAKGLAWCLIQQGQLARARDVLKRLLACDATDPLGAAEMLNGI